MEVENAGLSTREPLTTLTHLTPKVNTSPCRTPLRRDGAITCTSALESILESPQSYFLKYLFQLIRSLLCKICGPTQHSTPSTGYEADGALKQAQALCPLEGPPKREPTHSPRQTT